MKTTPAKPYQIVGLQPQDQMLIGFQNRTWDLAHLTAEEADYLLQYPEQVPYIKPVEVTVLNESN